MTYTKRIVHQSVFAGGTVSGASFTIPQNEVAYIRALIPSVPIFGTDKIRFDLTADNVRLRFYVGGPHIFPVVQDFDNEGLFVSPIALVGHVTFSLTNENGAGVISYGLSLLLEQLTRANAIPLPPA